MIKGVKNMKSTIKSKIESFVYGGGSSLIGHIRATKALIKFCEEHDFDLIYFSKLKDCLNFLEEGEVSNAYEVFKQIPSGKDGFGDWWPPVVYQKETEEYVWAVFEGLYERWCRLMDLL